MSVSYPVTSVSLNLLSCALPSAHLYFLPHSSVSSPQFFTPSVNKDAGSCEENRPLFPLRLGGVHQALLRTILLRISATVQTSDGYDDFSLNPMVRYCEYAVSLCKCMRGVEGGRQLAMDVLSQWLRDEDTTEGREEAGMRWRREERGGGIGLWILGALLLLAHADHNEGQNALLQHHLGLLRQQVEQGRVSMFSLYTSHPSGSLIHLLHSPTNVSPLFVNFQSISLTSSSFSYQGLSGSYGLLELCKQPQALYAVDPTLYPAMCNMLVSLRHFSDANQYLEQQQIFRCRAIQTILLDCKWEDSFVVGALQLVVERMLASDAQYLDISIDNNEIVPTLSIVLDCIEDEEEEGKKKSEEKEVDKRSGGEGRGGGDVEEEEEEETQQKKKRKVKMDQQIRDLVGTLLAKLRCTTHYAVRDHPDYAKLLASTQRKCVGLAGQEGPASPKPVGC